MIEPLTLRGPRGQPRFGVIAPAPNELDPLTGLGDRDYFLARATTALATSRGLKAVILLDIDGLRRINQGLGSSAGDEVLEALAQRLMAASRRDDVVARVGGDEFAGMLAGLGEGDEGREVRTR